MRRRWWTRAARRFRSVFQGAFKRGFLLTVRPREQLAHERGSGFGVVERSMGAASVHLGTVPVDGGWQIHLQPVADPP